MVATTDTTGKFRLTRVGLAVTSYYYSSAGSGSWVAVHTATVLPRRGAWCSTRATPLGRT